MKNQSKTYYALFMGARSLAIRTNKEFSYYREKMPFGIDKLVCPREFRMGLVDYDAAIAAAKESFLLALDNAFEYFMNEDYENAHGMFMSVALASKIENLPEDCQKALISRAEHLAFMAPEFEFRRKEKYASRYWHGGGGAVSSRTQSSGFGLGFFAGLLF